MTADKRKAATQRAIEAANQLTECLQKNKQMTMNRAAWMVHIKLALTGEQS